MKNLFPYANRFSFLNFARIITAFFVIIAGAQLSQINIYGQKQTESAGIDPTFTTRLAVGAYVQKTIYQPDGKAVVIGGFNDANGAERRNIVRVNADNSLDTSFNLPPDVFPLNLELLPDGKFMANGYTWLFRLNPDGSLDSSFNFNRSIAIDRLKVKPRSDGKFLVFGSFEVKEGDSIIAKDLIVVDQFGGFVNGLEPDNGRYIDDAVPLPNGRTIVVGRFNVKRMGQIVGRNFMVLDENGVPEPNFDGYYGAATGGERVRGVIIQPDGKYVLYGSFSQLYKSPLGGKSSPNKGIVRLNADGSFDRSFSTPFTSADIFSALIQADGKILFKGNIYFPDGSSRFFLSRVFSDGSFDNSFAANLPSTADFSQYLLQMELLPNGGVLMLGKFKLFNRPNVELLVKLNADGTLDATFQTPQILGGELAGFSLLPDGNVLISGNFGKIGSLTRIGLARLHPNGLLDENFRFDLSHNENVRVQTVTAQPDGKLIISGQFSVVNGEYIQNSQTTPYPFETTINAVVRLNVDGTLDSSFVPYTNVFNPVHCLVLQTDGKILLSGQARIKPNFVARLNADGTPDAGFMWQPIGDSIFRDAAVYAVAVQTDGKVIIGGDFPPIRNQVQGKIVRLNANGALDYSFNYPYYQYNTGDIIEKIILQPDGKIIAGGSPFGSSIFARPGLPRFNRSGTLDASFRWNQIPVQTVTREMRRLPDGKILFSGQIGGNGSEIYHPDGLARLNQNGEIEFQYNVKAEKFLPQADGKIILFNSNFQGGDPYIFTRIQPDGGADDTFRFTFNSYVNDFIQMPDGKIMVAGGFTKINGIRQIGLARLNP